MLFTGGPRAWRPLENRMSSIEEPSPAPPLTFVWRVGMSFDLRQPLPATDLPSGYHFAPFSAERLQVLSMIEHEAFRGSVDAEAFRSGLDCPTACLRSWRRCLASPAFDPERTVLLAQGDAICGFVAAQSSPQYRGLIRSLAVRPQHRGGTGRALLAECLRRYAEAGFTEVELCVSAPNPALRLYESAGFREVSWELQTYRRPA